jgi:cell wall-associated NlpC family hydrolase
MRFDKQKSDVLAQSFLEMKFEKKGRTPEGIDCLGIIILYYRAFGIEIPDYSTIEDWGDYDEEYVKAIPKLVRKLEKDEKPQIGDIIVFIKAKELTGALNHAGIFLGDSNFIHGCLKTGIRIDHLWDQDWKPRIYGFFRLREGDDQTDQRDNTDLAHSE